MNNKLAKAKVKAWQNDDKSLHEVYSYTSAGFVEPRPAHVHPEYQFMLSLNQNGEYLYRGACHQIPVGSLSILHTGEPHTTNGLRFFDAPASFYMFYIEPNEIRAIFNKLTSRKSAELPYFPQVKIKNVRLAQSYLKLFSLQEEISSNLTKESLRLNFFADLLINHAQNKSSASPYKANPKAVRLAIEYLQDNIARNISLDELAKVAGVNKFYLCRAFRREIGVSPHVYQIQMRIALAKQLLLKKKPLVEVALAIGFYDQSHFNKYFKKFVGTSPLAYAS